MDVRAQMERIYGELAPTDIPWNIERPPRTLVELVESCRIRPCPAVDLGCGAGYYAVWLAHQGFEVTGVDLSADAIARATALSRERGISCRFLAADLLDAKPPFESCFDFAFDWEVLHHVFPEERPRYVENVHRMLRPGGRYLSVCFSEDDPGFPGEGRYRQTSIGTTLYLSSEQELQALFARWFDVDELATIDVEGKRGPHRAVRALMTKTRERPREPRSRS